MQNYFSLFYHYIANQNYSGFFLNKQYWTILVVCHLFWWILLFVLIKLLNRKTNSNSNSNSNNSNNSNKLSDKVFYDSVTRIVSIVHASVVFWLAVFDILQHKLGENDTLECGNSNYFLQNVVILISLSYFLYDLPCCIFLECSDKEMVYHHISVITAYFTVLGFNNSGNDTMKAIVITEITNAVMHIRIIIKDFGMRDTKLYVTLDFIYMSVYIVARMVIGSYVSFHSVLCERGSLLLKCGTAFVYFQSVLFAKRMIHIIKHRLKEYEERKRKGIKLFWFEYNKQLDELDYINKAKLKKEKYVP